MFACRGKRFLKVVGAEPKDPGPKRLHARVEGWDLHASTAFAAGEHIAVERFCRYALRGPIANGRLTRGPGDKLTYRLKTPKPDGTTELVLSRMALLERLAHLIPQPGRHLTRYFGVLSSGAAWRPLIVPKPLEESDAPLTRRRGRRLDWANLLRRVFLTEIVNYTKRRELRSEGLKQDDDSPPNAISRSTPLSMEHAVLIYRTRSVNVVNLIRIFCSLPEAAWRCLLFHYWAL